MSGIDWPYVKKFLKVYAPRIPLLKWLPKYKKQYIGGDLIAGLTVGMMVVPQGLAYAASIAGLPAQVTLIS